MSTDAQLGARIKEFRAARGLSLDGLATQAEVSRAMLSRIERGESSPTAQMLNKICVGLGIGVSALFAAAEAPASPLARHAAQPLWRDPASGYLRRVVSPPGTGSAVDIVEVEFPPGASVGFDNRRMDRACQHVWVLDGTLELTLGEETTRLEQGDCLFMPLDRPIRFHNPSARPTRYAVILHHGARP
ncbi:XRE family transcriptional regulator [Rhodovarius crocodyli]|uniref:XRE family transcriptional regulator n=1 Tax=Rhodovarius crocodyli TaxID=1979269 RepID=A0A437MDN3_9PROT|nr:XRE family transcriptional regulator [Rhodovarius crocodyli]RVT95777.1 XRE family transcriptional regulator [Rhodovarius crocodyli]